MSPQQPAPGSPGAPLARLADDTTTTEGESLLIKGKKLLGLGGPQEGIGQAEKDAFAIAGEVAPTRTLAPASNSTLTSAPAPASTPFAPSLLPSPPLTASPFDRRASPRGSPRIAPIGIGASPNRRSVHCASSPGLHSPASSQIFERNVQEPEPSPAIPSHVKTEDMIPPALDASALAITDGHLSPEKVEIITHSAHQPAAASVSASMAESVYSPSLAPEDSVVSGHTSTTETTEAMSNYGSLDSEDVKRLSFISFADVVQAEHVENDRESFGPAEGIQFMSLNSTSANRSPSPVRSTLSSQGRTASPPTSGGPTSGAPSEKGVEHSGTRSAGSSPPPHVAHNAPLSEELPLQVETMQQAMRKPGTASHSPSQPLSVVSTEDENAFR
ncbi:uncharacterized protein M421DRAFT_341175 [Didymella exigua CBS 183.55]|uniref:Uncharacterized protein n=1 Tax=Didymella exigua CBS 183.55 TaxID=1150837 RepID=A0A6A5RUX7_9PLEO|nr:uncharacterized protein M421DRAFT_341175 [Didymella exigua CBS 183.55]KAF1931170.1 hypothetical protein M421DRAFT_341175 [Didymella exigua CBS 183.55]